MEPLFLFLDDVLFLHEKAIQHFGGTLGVRDQNGLESAVYHPQTIFSYTGDLFEAAAGYAFHIAQAQAFLDGNKRAGAAACLAFLDLNGITANWDDAALYDSMIAIAEKRASKKDLAEHLRQSAGDQPAKG